MNFYAVDGAGLQNAVGQAESSSGVVLVIGAGGGLGAALVAQLSSAAGGPGTFASVLALGRRSAPAIDYGNEASLKVRHWIGPLWGVEARVERYRNPSYVRTGANVGLFWQFQ